MTAWTAKSPHPRRRSVLGAGVVLPLASLTACGTPASPPETTLYTWISNENDRAQWEAFIAAAQEADPDFELTLEGPSFEDYWTKVKTRMSSRGTPALLTTQAARAQELSALLLPLDELAAEAGVYLGAFNAPMIAGMTVEGTVRGIPYDAEPMALFYNRAHFRDAGREVPGPTYTLDRFLDDAQALTTAERYGVALTSGLVGLGMAIGVAEGGAAVRDEELTLTDPALVDAIQFTFDLSAEHQVAAPPPAVDADPAAQQALMNGQVAMHLDGPWMYQAYADALGEDLGVAIVPSTGGEARGMLQGSGFGIASNAEDPSAAFATLSAIITPEVIGEVARTRGTFPSLAGQEERWTEGKNPDNARAITALAHDGDPLITTPSWNEVLAQFGQYAPEGFRGHRTAQDILAQVQKVGA
ncbi:ABC transporter substrate-binding protein [Brachybacterium sp. YJGR34]|uniref:ABC transporter substrate-binding protein n=1 Tax=Brachybacterium sp. YJGR34 TaxID=2059911 RepID=UPI00130028D0|nr:extracellular solute-binding protein [Brachybacterium sp. YJGR34]